MVFVVHAANPVRCTLVHYAGKLYVGTVTTYIRVFVDHVNHLKPKTPLKHSNRTLKLVYNKSARS